MLCNVVHNQAHRLISASFALKHTDGRALALTSIKPLVALVAHKSLRLPNDWHELLAYAAIDLCTVLWINVIVTDTANIMQLLSLSFRFHSLLRYVHCPVVLSCRMAHSFYGSGRTKVMKMAGQSESSLSSPVRRGNTNFFRELPRQFS
jgi:branched-subunit amino acid transport protein